MSDIKAISLLLHIKERKGLAKTLKLEVDELNQQAKVIIKEMRILEEVFETELKGVDE